MRHVYAQDAGPGIAMQVRRVLVLALFTCSLLALTPALASAASSIIVTPGLPTHVSLGDTNVPATVTITNANSGGDISSTVCEVGDAAPCTGTPGITLVPSCSSLDFSQSCLPSGANPGVFSVHNATGGAGTACFGKTFAVTVVDATFGKVRFAPSGGNVVLPTPGSSCRIDFQIDVLQLPADGSASAGYQTTPTAEAAAYSNNGTGTFSRNPQAAVNVVLAAPSLSDTDPDSPANDNAPEVKGSAPAGTTQVRLFTNAACTGTPIAQGTASDFASPGLTASVSDDTTTTFYAAAVDNLNGVSNCSTTSITYIEDSTPPAAPVPNDTDPDSPSNDNSPHVKGTAAALSTVRIYTNPNCTGSAVATGTAAEFASPGLSVTVPSDSTTTFYATAADAAGNISGCSASSVNYVEDSTAPGVPTVSGTSPASPANNNGPRITGSADAGSTVKIYTNSACTGSPAVSGSAAAFAPPGLQAAVANDTTTTFYATATDMAGNASACSAPGTTYVEDSTPPANPILSGTSPASPANDNAPRVMGSAEAGAAVELYTDSACATPFASSGSAASLASPGLSVSVADNTTTTFYAQATDAAGNVSHCSSSSTTYVEDSTAPPVSIDSGPTGTASSATPTFTFSSAEQGSTFECALDTGAYAACTSPFTTGALAAGDHTFLVRAKDAAGNIGSPVTRTFTVSATVTPPPPVAPPPPPVTPPPPPPVTPAQTGCRGIAGKVYLGTAGRNIANGTAKTDIMFGLSGNDSLRGAGGLDCLYGGPGNDVLRGGTGNDREYGGTGNDVLVGDAGSDRLSGQSGVDRINGGAGNDTSFGGAGRDSLTDRSGRDRLSGGAGNDRLDARDSSAAGRRVPDRILCGTGVDKVLADPIDIVSRDCERRHVVRRSLTTH